MDDSERHDEERLEIGRELPLVPLRDVVLLPGAVVPLLVGRERSVHSLELAAEADKLLVVTVQTQPDISDPKARDLRDIGTVARIHQMLRLPDGTTKILVEGLHRVRITAFIEATDHLSAEIELFEAEAAADPTELEALLRQSLELFGQYASAHQRLPEEVSNSVNQIGDGLRRADAIGAWMVLPAEEKQELLEQVDPLRRLRRLVQLLHREVEILRVEERIEDEMKDSVERGHKEAYLNERLRAIRKELGYGDDDDDEVEEYLHKIENTEMSEEAREVAHKEISRLAKMAPMSPESTVTRHYLDILCGMPWQKRSEDQLDTRRAKKHLDQDHHGLEKAKERILEFLSVVKLSGNVQGSILCLAGPPGVGKTSLGRSIADAMGRNFVRVSLGGIRDEAEIRGHRRTYIGSRPGRVLEGIRRAGTRNCVFLLDEIDKLGSDFRGDPSSALLEVLDPEQNKAYSDHFLEVPFDLSEVFFICTANDIHQIPPALEDRMEILRLPGYLEHEKVAIARDFLLPRLRESHGLARARFTISEAAISDAISLYTREAGVRGLERQLATICRKIARRKAERRPIPKIVQRTNLHKFLGPPQFLRRMVDREPEIGVVTGLAWTSTGGEILEIEVAIFAGTGKLQITGNLRKVMEESAQTALSYTRATVPKVAAKMKKQDIHIHVPEGAVPKDGPSAGIAMAVALTSMFTGRPVRRDVAMTGEITLRGKVLPIGGLPEKAVAAQRAGCVKILIPEENDKDYRELPKDVQQGLQWHLVRRMDEVLDLALLPEKHAASTAADAPRSGESPGAAAH
ncbi:endopeptidase La [bacterium]|nr:MAG: endopeptidase La [bacterium]